MKSSTEIILEEHFFGAEIEKLLKSLNNDPFKDFLYFLIADSLRRPGEGDQALKYIDQGLKNNKKQTDFFISTS